MLMPTRILVPTDFSEPSDRALKQALDIARQYHAKVFLLHVIHEETQHPVAFDFGLDEEIMRQMNIRIRDEAKQRLQDQLEKFPQAKEVEVTTDIRKGITYEEILKEEKSKEIDLIVIASLGKTGLAKYLIGSVARNVLRGSACPVLLTK